MLCSLSPCCPALLSSSSVIWGPFYFRCWKASSLHSHPTKHFTWVVLHYSNLSSSMAFVNMSPWLPLKPASYSLSIITSCFVCSTAFIIIRIVFFIYSCLVSFRCLLPLKCTFHVSRTHVRCSGGALASRTAPGTQKALKVFAVCVTDA